MKILLLEPFFTGSHQQWAEGFATHSQHEIKILSLPGKYWKWRMYGGAVSLAEQFLASNFQPDLLLATDMLDLTTFLSLTRKRTAHLPTAVYFHENQITYPWSPTDADVALKRNNQYGFLNYTTALTADRVFFNSDYHQQSFLGALPAFLKQFPDFKETHLIEKIQAKSEVLYLGMNLKKFDSFKIKTVNESPILLWNHRWEYDKNPDIFFQTLFKLKEKGIDFKLVVLGESYQKMPPIFTIAQDRLSDRMLHFGYAKTFDEYAKWLWQADILPVTSNQDFFGGSVVEAMYCECLPILPNRLAYQEHIPKAVHSDFFYENDDDFYLKLEGALLDFFKNKRTSTGSFVEHYDWRTLARVYDDKFEKMVVEFSESSLETRRRGAVGC